MSTPSPVPPAPAAPQNVPTITLRGCLVFLLELVGIALAVTVLPIVVLLLLIRFEWPWYSSIPLLPPPLPPPAPASLNFDDALIALASVAGVLWSGAIVAYSIHRKYTPPLRTGVQLLNYAIVAPLIGLVARGASLRTAFFLVAWFFILSFLLSTTSLQMLKPRLGLKIPDAKPNETPEETKARLRVSAILLKNIDLFTRLAYGTRFFALTAALSLWVFITADVSVITWTCLVVLVLSLFLMLPEVFRLDDAAPSISSPPAEPGSTP